MLWKDFLIAFVIACLLYVGTRWTLNRIDRWIEKKYSEKEDAE